MLRRMPRSRGTAAAADAGLRHLASKVCAPTMARGELRKLRANEWQRSLELLQPFLEGKEPWLVIRPSAFCAGAAASLHFPASICYEGLLPKTIEGTLLPPNPNSPAMFFFSRAQVTLVL